MGLQGAEAFGPEPEPDSFSAQHLDQRRQLLPPVARVLRLAKQAGCERRHLRIDELPGNLSEALDDLQRSALMRDALGDHIFDHFLAAKRAEWDGYIRHVSPWEIERYLNTY